MLLLAFAAASGAMTPMAERVVTLAALNKRSGRSETFTAKPGEQVSFDALTVRVRACEKTASWEAEQYTGAFLQLDVLGTDDKWRRIFSGWTFRERPGLNVVQHPIYDVWVKSCTMAFPAVGPDTVVAGRAPKTGSSAKKSPVAARAPSN